MTSQPNLKNEKSMTNSNSY